GARRAGPAHGCRRRGAPPGARPLLPRLDRPLDAGPLHGGGGGLELRRAVHRRVDRQARTPRRRARPARGRRSRLARPPRACDSGRVARGPWTPATTGPPPLARGRRAAEGPRPRMGATASTFPGGSLPERLPQARSDSPAPPPILTWRRTTARDLARILWTL